MWRDGCNVDVTTTRLLLYQKKNPPACLDTYVVRPFPEVHRLSNSPGDACLERVRRVPRAVP